jgi:MFS family permease
VPVGNSIREKILSDQGPKMIAQRLRVTRLVAGLAVAQLCSVLGSAAYASTLVKLAALWHLDSTRAGWISSAYFLGYAAGVPLLVALTDRVDARVVYFAGCAIGAISGVSFSVLANGVWSAFLLQALAGVATGATYMPGLRLLTTRLGKQARIRAVPYYTAAWSLGTSLSFLMSGWVAERYGWRATFLVGGLGSLLAAVLAWCATTGVPLQPDLKIVATRHPLDFRPVLKNRRAIAYILAYGGHCWELFAFRAWLPTFLLFAWHRYSNGSAGLRLSRWSMLIILIGVPASILGAESVKAGMRSRLARSVEFICILTCMGAVISSSISFHLALIALFLYNIAIMADSGALTAGAVEVATPDAQGATLAIYTLVGFVGAAIGPLLVGTALDLGGGFGNARAWYLGFAAMGAGSVLAAVAMSALSVSESREKRCS